MRRDVRYTCQWTDGQVRARQEPEIDGGFPTWDKRASRERTRCRLVQMPTACLRSNAAVRVLLEAPLRDYLYPPQPRFATLQIFALLLGLGQLLSGTLQ
jgi:hypothetical protein